MKHGLLALLLWFAAGVSAWAAGPSVRVSLAAKQPILVGQQVHLQVTILTPNYFTSAPPFPPLAVPGAIVTMPDESGQNSTETIGGVTYAGIRKTYIFSAQQEGEFTLPPVEIAFTYGGDDGKPRHAKVKMPPFKITAKLPPGAAAAASAAGGGGLMPVARVTITQSFDRPGSTFHVGDALVRTINTTVDRTQSMMIPPPEPEKIDGVRTFAADPVLRDETRDREGLVAGHRTDKLTYVFEKLGTYTLPAVEITWFDATANKSRTAQAPELVVKVEPGPATQTAIAPEAASAAASAAPARTGHRWRTLDVIEAVVAAALVALLVWIAMRWLRRHLPVWRARRTARQAAHAVSEPSLYAAVQAARQGGAAQVHAATLAWSRHTGGSMSAWVAACADAELSQTWAELQAAAWSVRPAAGWDASRFLGAFGRCRDAWRQAARLQAPSAALPALNP